MSCAFFTWCHWHKWLICKRFACLHSEKKERKTGREEGFMLHNCLRFCLFCSSFLSPPLHPSLPPSFSCLPGVFSFVSRFSSTVWGSCPRILCRRPCRLRGRRCSSPCCHGQTARLEEESRGLPNKVGKNVKKLKSKVQFRFKKGKKKEKD